MKATSVSVRLRIFLFAFKIPNNALLRYGSHCACHVVGTGAVRWKPCSVMGDRAKRHQRPSPKGVRRGGICVRGPEGSGEPVFVSEAQRGRASRCLCPSPGNYVWFVLSFAIFIALIWVSLFMVPNSSLRAFEGVKAPVDGS